MKYLNIIIKLFLYLYSRITLNLLILTIIIGFIFNLYLIYFSFFLLFLKIFSKKKNFFYLIVSYIFLGFLLFDLYSKQDFTKSDYKTISNIEYEINQYFGYQPKKNSILKEKVYFKEKLIHEFNYSINKFGHRETLNKYNNLEKCVIFHGGSITFGQAVNDDETLPYYISKKLNDKYSVFNFAFNGYGPHQFLSKIENNYFEEVKNCKKVFIVYQFINDHVGRTAGRRSWGDKAPRYLIKDGKIYQKGFFSNYPYKLIMKFRKNMRNSKLISIFYNVENVNKKDVEIFLKILRKIEFLSKKIFNESEFIYLIWNEEKKKYNKIYNFFYNNENININKIDISNKIKRNNIPGDNHPTGEFNFIISRELFKLIN